MVTRASPIGAPGGRQVLGGVPPQMIKPLWQELSEIRRGYEGSQPRELVSFSILGSPRPQHMFKSGVITLLSSFTNVAAIVNIR